MKNIMLAVFILLAVSCFGQPVIIYQDAPVAQWDAITLDDTGHPLLPDDVVDYTVYIWDQNLGEIESQLVASLVYIGVTGGTEMPFTMPYRSRWAVAVRARLVNSSGTYLAPMAYSTEPPPVTKDGAFVVSKPTWILQKVRSIRIKP